MHEPQSVVSPDDGHLGCFQVLVIMNEIVICITQAFCVDICFHFSWGHTKSGIIGLYSNCIFNFIFIFIFGRAACGILVPRPGMEPMPPAFERWSLNHWTAWEVPIFNFIRKYKCSPSSPVFVSSGFVLVFNLF